MYCGYSRFTSGSVALSSVDEWLRHVKREVNG
jgi:hypothetical protein